MPAVGDFFFQHQFHKLLCGRGHILKTLSERNHRKAHPLKVLHHLHSAPAVEGDLTDVVALAQAFDKFFNVAVVDYIAFCRLQISLPLPHIIWHMIAPNTKIDIVLRYPEVRQDDVFVLLVLRREHKHKGGDIHCGGQVQPAVTGTAFQFVLIDGKDAVVPFLHRHPANRLLDPLVQTKLAKSVLFAGILLG